jgi:CrcB protein
MNLILVALGGACGAMGRYAFGGLVAFPFGTLGVNLIGAVLMGLAFVLLSDRGDPRLMGLVMTGFLGGFTTFSAFSLDVLKLVEDGRLGFALTYVFASVIGSIVLIFVTVWLSRGVLQ